MSDAGELSGGEARAPSPASSPSPTAVPTQSPYQRDVERTSAGRNEIEAVRTEAARRRQSGEPPLQSDERPDAGPAPSSDALDGTALRTGEQLRLRGQNGKEFTLGADDVSRPMEQHAADLQRKATTPVDPSGYEPKLPDTFKAPEGTEIRIDHADPALADLKAWAYQRGMSQSDFSDVLSIYAQRQAREASAFAAARTAEVQKLGVNASARIDAVANWWRAQSGDDGRVLDQVRSDSGNDTARVAAVRALEEMEKRLDEQTGGRGSGMAPGVTIVFELPGGALKTIGPSTIKGQAEEVDELAD